MSDIRGMHHTGLHVRDLAGSVAFYRDLLGLEVLAEREARADYVGEVVGYPGATIRMAWLRHAEGGPILELLQYVDPAGSPVDTATPNPGTAHLAFSVPDIHATFERLRAAGVAFKSAAPVAITAGANRGGYAVYFTDPDGITLQVAPDRHEFERSTRRSSAGTRGAGCPRHRPRRVADYPGGSRANAQPDR